MWQFKQTGFLIIRLKIIIVVMVLVAVILMTLQIKPMELRKAFTGPMPSQSSVYPVNTSAMKACKPMP
jgi:hypothetical protein